MQSFVFPLKLNELFNIEKSSITRAQIAIFFENPIFSLTAREHSQLMDRGRESRRESGGCLYEIETGCFVEKYRPFRDRRVLPVFSLLVKTVKY